MLIRSPRAWVVLALASFALMAPSAAQAEAFDVQLVRVKTPVPASHELLQTIGLDLADGGGRTWRDAVLWRAEDAAKLRSAGLEYTVRVPDLVARFKTDRRRDRAFATAVRRSAFPSGRTDYRTLEDYNAEMRTLAEANPDLVRLITLPLKSVQGQDVLGIEIAQNVKAHDGRPVFLQLGVHHAREWPSAEHTLEWGYEMINGTKSGDARASRLTKDIRTIVIPLVNPDGFDISRDFGPLDNPDGGAAEVFAYKRKNCNVANQENPPATPQPLCIAGPALGTDPNRNYGGLWGGPGASAVPGEADYRGPAPFSEPETRNIQQLVSSRHVVTLITNHTFTGLVLRPPGVAEIGPSIDEPLLKQLGDDMAARNGYISQPGYDLYDTTGTTEDWTYPTTGGLGYTFEIGPDQFHPPYEEVVAEWEGTGDLGQAAPVGGGNREAYYVAAESTANAARHSVIEGTAPAGRVLRLKKEFMTQTSPVQGADGAEGAVREFKDVLDTTMTVPSSGSFRWDINPSTRPAVADRPGRVKTGEPSDPIDDLVEPPIPPNGTVVIPFTYARGAGRDDGTMTVEVTNPAPAEDYDIEVYRKLPAGGRVREGASAQFVASREAVDIPDPIEGDYELEVTNFAASGVSYTARVVFRSPRPPVEGITENWTLTCETADGTVVASQPLLIFRGERKVVNPCGTATAPGGGGAAGGGNKPTPATPGGTATCVSGSGLISATARGTRASGVAFDFRRRIKAPVTVDVFRQSAGRRIIGERLVRRFSNRADGFTWDGRDAKRRRVGDGYYFARFRMRVAGGQADTIRVTLARSAGRFVLKRAFHQRDTCGALQMFKLYRSVFGGRGSQPLRIGYRLSRPGEVTVTVADRRRRVVKRFAARQVAAGRMQRLSVPARGLGRGDFRITITLRQGGQTITSTLTARRL